MYPARPMRGKPWRAATPLAYRVACGTMAPAMRLRVKRAYDAPAPDDGVRVLVDRLWPRGITKARARIDLWLKDVAPSAALRAWFGHDTARWTGFRDRYFRELERHPDAVAQLRALARKGSVTLVFGARDEQHNNAVALGQYLASHPARARRRRDPAHASR